MSIYSDLLFLQGHITNVELAQRLVDEEHAAAPSNALKNPSTSPTLKQKRHAPVIDQVSRNCSAP